MKKVNPWIIAKYLFLFIAVALIIIPLFFIAISSIKTNEEIFQSAFKLPARPNIKNYMLIFNENYHLYTYFLNSSIYAVLVCSLSAIINTMAAYAVGRMKWKLNKPTMGFFLAGIMIPLHAIIVPLYIITARFRIPNQITLALLYTASTIPTSVFLVTGYLRNVPRAVEESAVIDGSSIPYLFFIIIIPIIKPAIATMTIFNFMGVWNDLMLSLIFLSEDKFKTLQLGLMRFRSATYNDYGLLLTAMVVSIIPIIIVYLFMSEKIIGGITAGAVKG
jgi:raffinose/stachyose/melibiose transport system permease protein